MGIGDRVWGCALGVEDQCSEVGGHAVGGSAKAFGPSWTHWFKVV
jgi:hypothetical protein